MNSGVLLRNCTREQSATTKKVMTKKSEHSSDPNSNEQKVDENLYLDSRNILIEKWKNELEQSSISSNQEDDNIKQNEPNNSTSDLRSVSTCLPLSTLKSVIISRFISLKNIFLNIFSRIFFRSHSLNLHQNNPESLQEIELVSFPHLPDASLNSSIQAPQNFGESSTRSIFKNISNYFSSCILHTYVPYENADNDVTQNQSEDENANNDVHKDQYEDKNADNDVHQDQSEDKNADNDVHQDQWEEIVLEDRESKCWCANAEFTGSRSATSNSYHADVSASSLNIRASMDTSDELFTYGYTSKINEDGDVETRI